MDSLKNLTKCTFLVPKTKKSTALQKQDKLIAGLHEVN
jgi:hypothetical protein